MLRETDNQEVVDAIVSSRSRRAAETLGLERNVLVVSGAVFLRGAGEELWKKFLPKHLEVGPPSNIRGVWASFHGALKRLLVSDIVIRTCEGMAGILIVLYATNVVGVSFVEYGALVAVQMATSILVYLPPARVADRTGRKPFVIATFGCFALFPIAVAYSTGFASLVVAFVIGGLRDIGEPARKAMIVDFAEPHLRARSVGLYYLIRCLSITPAAAVGGALYTVDARLPFVVAGAIGLAGVLVFTATVEERYAG